MHQHAHALVYRPKRCIDTYRQKCFAAVAVKLAEQLHQELSD